MRFTAKAYAEDTRKAKPANAKEGDKPEGGWRTKSGVVLLGKADINVETFSEAVEKTGELIGGMSEAGQKLVRRVKIEAAGESAAKGNPFE